ncbi:SDR family NAD(P)-dependent oxidoreductase [Streptomyces sp. NPDC002537]
MRDRAAVDRRLARDPVAIVGLAALFPKAPDLRAFWDNIVAGRDCTEDVPGGWWDTGLHHEPDPFAEDKTYCRRGGFLTPELFDPVEFGMPPKTLDSTGLVQLLGLRVAKDVLADASRGRTDWHDPARTGVVLGVCGTNSTLLPLAARVTAREMARTMLAHGVPRERVEQIVRAHLSGLPPWTEDSFPGVLGNVVSGRVANRLDLRAANHTVDAACASSLAAVRGAVDELLARRADVMITGGADADNSVVSFLCFSKTPALSLTGRVRPFDEAADGTLVGEGIGMLALKRLDDAERDGDRVYAVLRGLGSSSDGQGQSIYAPCGEGQLTALRRAYHDADCPPPSVGLVEAHGTGTAAGDAVELSALDRLMAGADEHRFAALGSIKSQIGHTKAAAGAAGLIKAALALHHRVLPPTINVAVPSAQAAREDSAFYLNTVARPWLRSSSRPTRRAGVSAFGFGGVNYHAVLEEAPPGTAPPEHALHRTPRAVLWHAATTEELRRRLEEGAAPDEGPVPAGHARLGFVADGEEEHGELLAAAVERLRRTPDEDGWAHARGIHFRRRALPPDAAAGALFSGQGGQYTDMGRHAALAVPAVRAAFDAANALFPGPDSLARAVFPPPAAGDDGGRLRRTAYAQPAIGALSRGQYAFLRELGFAPREALGHSFGELTALWAAGVLDDGAFTALAHARGQAMRLVPGRDAGAMAVVRAPQETLPHLLAAHPELTLCNRNAPDEHVVGGPAPAVEEFVRHSGATARRLPVEAAFHTAHVAHAVEEFARACAQASFAAPALTVHANTPGAAYGADPEGNRRTLVGQLRNPVDFAARLEEMYADGVRVFVEFGPGSTLTRLVERTLGDRGVETVACDACPGGDSCAALKLAAVRLAVLGLPLTGINRHDAPPPPGRPAPSKAARTLEGPHFATLARRPAFEALLADRAATVRPLTAESPAPGVPLPTARTAEADPLAAAAAGHLAAHTRYLDGQLHVAQQLAGLLQRHDGGAAVDPELARMVTAVTEHSLALGEAHTKAGEVVTELLRLPTGVAGPAADARPPVAVPPEEDVPEERSALAELWSAGTAATGDREPPGVGDRGPGAPDVDLDELQHVLLEVAAEKTGYHIDMIEPDMLIQEDLGIDSLKRVEIGAEMWRRFPGLDRADMYRLVEARTVRELSGMFHEILGASWALPRAYRKLRTGRGFVTLRELPHPDVCAGIYPPRPHALLVDAGDELSGTLDAALRAEGWRTSHLRLPATGATVREEPDGPVPLADRSEAALTAGLEKLLSRDGRPDLCVLSVGRSSCSGADEVIERLKHAVMVAKHLCPVLSETAAQGHRAAFVTVTELDGALGHEGAGGDPALAFAGGLGGLVKTVALEAPALFCRALDFAPGTDPRRVAEAFTAEIADLATDLLEVGRDATRRRAPHVSETPPAAEPEEAGQLGGKDLLLVTGGASGITSWCVSALADRYRCGFLLLGRTPLTGQGENGPRRQNVHAVLTELRARGIDAEYVSADIRDAAATATALTPYAARITGVLHGAGVLGDRPLAEMTPESVGPVVDTKAGGLSHVLDALPAERLRHLVLFSSVAGVWGNPRQSDYALANEAVVRFGRAFRAAHPGCRVLSVAWSPWAGGMAARMREVFEILGVPVLTREAGCEHLLELMGGGAGGTTGAAVVGPLEPMVKRSVRLPRAGATARRTLTGHTDEPVLRDHCFAGVPVLPMTAVLGTALHTVERALGGAETVVECRDFRITRGIAFPPGHPDRVLLRLAPEPGPGGEDDTARVSVYADDPERTCHAEALVRWSTAVPTAPRIELPPYTLDDTSHPGYAEGLLFHGPTLAGLRNVLEEHDDRLVVVAKMPAPPLAHGAYAARLHSPALADLLLQSALITLRRDPRDGRWPIPVAVGRVELFSPLPDDAPFVVRTDVRKRGPGVFSDVDITACAPDGRVHQRWSGVRMLWAELGDVVHAARGPFDARD